MNAVQIATLAVASLNLVATVGGLTVAYIVTKQIAERVDQAEKEVDDVRVKTNSTIKKFAKTLGDFQV